MSKSITTKMVRCLELRQIIKWLESVLRDPNEDSVITDYRNFLRVNEVSSLVGGGASGGPESLQFISTVIPGMTQQIIAHSLTEAKRELQTLLREIHMHVRELETFFE